MSAQYPGSTITYGEVTQNMANSLKMTIYGTLGSGTVVPLTDAELIAFVNMQNCNATRKHIITTGLALVGSTVHTRYDSWHEEFLGYAFALAALVVIVFTIIEVVISKTRRS